MLIHEPSRLDGHLTRVRSLQWPLPRSLRAAVDALLVRRGWRVRNRHAPAGVLSLALLVSSLPASDINAAGPFLAAEGA